jgi:hypothetical protein
MSANIVLTALLLITTLQRRREAELGIITILVVYQHSNRVRSHWPPIYGIISTVNLTRRLIIHHEGTKDLPMDIFVTIWRPFKRLIAALRSNSSEWKKENKIVAIFSPQS